MRLPERDPYAPREWQPHEKPALLGSPSTPEHPTPKRIAYGIVGLLVCLTDAGRELVDRAVERHVANERRMLAPLTLAEQDQLAALLKRWLLENE